MPALICMSDFGAHMLYFQIEVEVECDLSVRQRRLYEGLRQKITLEDLLTANNPMSKAASDQMNKHLMNLVMQFRKVYISITWF